MSHDVSIIDQITINRYLARIAHIDTQITRLNRSKTYLQQEVENLRNKNSHKVRRVHDELMEYFQANYYRTSPTDNDFLIPYRPINFNVSLQGNSSHQGVDDYKYCEFPAPLGSDAQGGSLTFLDLYGYFGTTNGLLITESTSMSNILNNRTQYNIAKIEINAIGIGYQTRVYNIRYNYPYDMRRYINNVAYTKAMTILNGFNLWASTTGFLAPLEPLCLNYYYNTYGDGVIPPYTIKAALDNYNLSVSQTPSASTKDPSEILPNSLQRQYFDRLYDFMEVTKYSESTTLSIIKNFSLKL